MCMSKTEPKNALDLLLIRCPPPWDLTLPPIGIAYLSTYAKSRGIQTDAWDLSIKLFQEPGLEDIWDQMNVRRSRTHRFFAKASALAERAVEAILESGARYIGFSLHHRNVIFTERIVQMVRARDKSRIIIFGGPEVSLAHFTDALHKMTADLFVVGDGEQTLAEAILLHQKTGRFEPIPGLIIRKGNRFSELTPRPPILDLDSVPFPTWEEFALDQYRYLENDPKLPFLFSRGCVGNCSFCSDPMFSGQYRTRSAAHAVAEMKHHIEQVGIHHFVFNDLLCNGNPEALEALCDRITQEKLAVRWRSYAVMSSKLTPNLLQKMRRAGCYALEFGMESGSDHVLKLMHKRFNAKIAEQTLRDCTHVGIQACINIVVGFPGEMQEDFQETLDFISRNKDCIHTLINLGTLDRTPGSEIDRFPEKFGVIPDPATGSWKTNDGNDRPERIRRLEQVLTLIKELRIPLNITNCEGIPYRP